MLFTSSSFAKYSGGSGEPNNPYQIADVNDLLTLANDANDYNKCFIMTADIDLDPNLPGNKIYTNAVIAPDINSSTYNFEGTSFSGSFDGRGKKIMNMRINTADANNSCLGLFGDINGFSAQVKNLNIDNAVITSGTDSFVVGGLCGYNEYGMINDCCVTCQVNGGTGSYYLGGLCGYNDNGTISRCFTICNIIGGDNSFSLGGMCGMNYFGTIDDCYADGSVSGDQCIGGLCGYNRYGLISNCHSSNQVAGEADSECLGGLCGDNWRGTISNCYAYGSVTGGNNSKLLGGLCGYNFIGIIKTCYADGQVCGGTNSSRLGGLCGENYGEISDCYSSGSILGGSYLGGLCGRNYYSSVCNCYATGSVTGSDFIGGFCGYSIIGPITNCYSTGLVTGSQHKGGFCGYDEISNLTTCFWDINTSGCAISSGGNGKTTTQMQTQNTFSSAGWDFVWETVNGPNDVWAICEGVSYPKLAWQYVIGDSDNDKDVDFVDFAPLGNKWMQADPTLYCGGTDLTGDGFVDLEDLAAFVENWLQ